jgi:hypothetical protein
MVEPMLSEYSGEAFRGHTDACACIVTDEAGQRVLAARVKLGPTEIFLERDVARFLNKALAEVVATLNEASPPGRRH